MNVFNISLQRKMANLEDYHLACYCFSISIALRIIKTQCSSVKIIQMYEYKKVYYSIEQCQCKVISPKNNYMQQSFC